MVALVNQGHETEQVRTMSVVREAKLTTDMVGISATSAKPGEELWVTQRGLYTSDDGPHLYQYLEAFSQVLAPVFAGIRIETIASAVINITEGRNLTAWVNAEAAAMRVIPRRNLEARALVTHDDLAHITQIKLNGIDPEPTTGGLIYICRIAWRTGLFFDLTMLRKEPQRPIQDFRGTIALVHNAILLRERIGFDDVTLRGMYPHGWFPFIGLPTAIAVELGLHVRNAWPIGAELERKAVDAVSPRIPQMIETWKKKDSFSASIRSLSEAARLFSAKEYEAAYAIAWPRIEGVLRQIFLRSSTDKPEYKRLRLAMVREAAKRFRGRNALLPEQFSEYLDTYWLAPFDLAAGNVPTSRHSLAHGVASGDELKDPAHCLRVFLTLEQIFHYAP